MNSSLSTISELDGSMVRDPHASLEHLLVDLVRQSEADCMNHGTVKVTIFSRNVLHRDRSYVVLELVPE